MDDAVESVFSSLIAVEECAKEFARIDREVFHRGFWKNLFSAIDFKRHHKESGDLLSSITAIINEMDDANPMLLLAKSCGLAIYKMHEVISGLKDKAEGLGGPNLTTHNRLMGEYSKVREAFIALWNRK